MGKRIEDLSVRGEFKRSGTRHTFSAEKLSGIAAACTRQARNPNLELAMHTL